MNQVSNVSTETDYNIIKELADKYGIRHVGVKKTEVIQQINLKLEEEKEMGETIEKVEVIAEEVKAVEEVKVEAAEVVEETVTEETVVEETPTENLTEASTDQNEEADKPEEAAPTAEVKSGKWFEQEGTTYTYEEGQKIQITGGYAPLIGRYAQITGPSKKRDAVKARLFKPNKPSELQDTNVTFNIGDFELFEGEVPVIENKRAKKKENEEVAAQQEVAATVEPEQVDTTTEQDQNEVTEVVTEQEAV